MKTYERIIKEYLDIQAVYKHDSTSIFDTERKQKALMRVTKIPLDVLEAYREQLFNCHKYGIGLVWTERTVDRLAEKLCRKFYSGRFVDGAVTPMGICSRCCISFVKNHLRDWRERESELRLTDGVAARELYRERFSKPNSISITIQPGDLSIGQFSVVDYTVDMGGYKPGTIGFLNGMNYPSIPIPKDANLEWFRPLIR